MLKWKLTKTVFENTHTSKEQEGKNMIKHLRHLNATYMIKHNCVFFHPMINIRLSQSFGGCYANGTPHSNALNSNFYEMFSILSYYIVVLVFVSLKCDG